jgi:hypothetical protein
MQGSVGGVRRERTTKIHAIDGQLRDGSTVEARQIVAQPAAGSNPEHGLIEAINPDHRHGPNDGGAVMLARFRGKGQTR